MKTITVIALALAGLLAGCSVEPDNSGDALPSIPDADPDADAFESPDTDATPSCEPGCHWDCFGGRATCEAGVVWPVATGF